MPDYNVSITVTVFAYTPEEAAANAQHDLRDDSLGPWYFDVEDLDTGIQHEVKLEMEDDESSGMPCGTFGGGDAYD